MSSHRLHRDGLSLRYVDEGGPGLPLIFQHGLGGSEAQVAESVPRLPGIRRLTLECRGHGGSDMDPAARYGIAPFADDVLALADHCGVRRFVVGGISMGAAIALHLAVRHPDRILGLILARPAFAFAPAPPNMRPNSVVADYLEAFPGVAARERFEASAIAAQLRRDAPDNLASLMGFFDRPDRATTVRLLRQIAGDDPGVMAAEAALLDRPALVLGHAVDHVHPLAMAEELAAVLPRAELRRLTPKATDKPRFLQEFGAAIAAFLGTLQPLESLPPQPKECQR